jgi:RimJ/RimL family protein N-acetyltransferase
MTSIRLRKIVTDDLAEMFRQEIDPVANQMAAMIPREEAAFRTHWLKILSDPGVIARAIVTDDLLAGYIACFKSGDEAMVGYRIGQEFWGRGVATRALELMLRLVDARPLHARVALHNKGSLRVLEKCGFVIVGQEHAPATERLLECDEAILILR